MSSACLQHAELWIYSGWKSARWGLIQKQTMQKKHQAGTLKGKLTKQTLLCLSAESHCPCLREKHRSLLQAQGGVLPAAGATGGKEKVSLLLSFWWLLGAHGEKGCFNGGSDCWTWGVSATRTAFCSRVGAPFHRAGTASLISSPARHSLALC